MKLLLDQNLSRRLLPELESHFPGSSHVQLVGFESASDGALWEFAKANGYAIVTKDVDFVEIMLVRGFPPKIVWLNCGNVSNAVTRDRLMSRSTEIRTFLVSADEGVLEIE
ncbi:DUF5615 family PIN-like protein [Pseudothauera lacus]|uniref:DUF5615 domain-containing protein n=1 Tax=Pseudothauera lacus TaxID=2136175 RepID=A0A2T4IES4_9RHOO|nr:DUF5615 family PIN-like protein [Pseudothauera lacus]PTD96274.1 hypothetical protein C8261_10160 [Pseudothauera lacus]